jgi:hypothetical protein
MVLTVSFVLSPVIGLLTPSPAELPPPLDTSAGVSGPHDFSVRVSAIRQRRIHVHRIPPRVRDVAQRPSVGQDGGVVKVICPTSEAKYFCKQDWTENQQIH